MSRNNYKDLLRSIGPGILFAGAAIGASHIVQSTRAGASYGFALLIFVILSNFFKYPFFEYGQRYTAATGETIIDGYRKMGKIELLVFFVLNHLTSVISTAGVTLVTAALSAYLLDLFFGIQFNDITNLSIIILSSVILILVLGKYSALDKIVKVLIVVLGISTIVAFILASTKGMQAEQGFQAPEIFNYSGFIFLIALMGWMPAPIEASTWSSVWMKERAKETSHFPTVKESLTDFRIGYIGTAILACFFLGLGAYVMFGTGQEFGSGVSFVKQVISLYTETLGNWSLPIIAVIAFVTMASTTMTVTDAYPRTIARCMNIYFKDEKLIWYKLYLVGVSIVAILIIDVYEEKIKAMIDFATTISFLAAPFFSYINYKLVISDNMPEEHRPGKFLRYLSVFGIFFLSAFGLIFIYVRFFSE